MLFFPEAKGDIFPYQFYFLPVFISFLFSAYPYSSKPVLTQCQRITVWVSTKIQHKAMAFAKLTPSHSQNQPFQMLSDSANSFSM